MVYENMMYVYVSFYLLLNIVYLYDYQAGIQDPRSLQLVLHAF